MYYLKFGSRGDAVKELQIALNIEADGIFGRMTEAAVKNYQRKNGMYPDGVATPEIQFLLLGDDYTTDLSENKIIKSDLNINKYYLRDNQYVNESTDKKYIFLHHTAGSSDPYRTIDSWEKDDRGRIATQYVIGGIDDFGNSQHDGEIVECFPDEAWAYHLGNVDNYMHSHSIGIEICNWGWLTEKNGKYFTYTGKQISREYVTKLMRPFRGFYFFHKYTQKQIESVNLLLVYLSKKHDIDLTKGILQWMNELNDEVAFEYFNDAATGKIKGLLSHTNVRKDKTDVYPDKRLIKIIKGFA